MKDQIQEMQERLARERELAKFQALPVRRCEKGTVFFTEAYVQKAGKSGEHDMMLPQTVWICNKCNKLHPDCANIGNIPADQISTCEMREYIAPSIVMGKV